MVFGLGILVFRVLGIGWFRGFAKGLGVCGMAFGVSRFEGCRFKVQSLGLWPFQKHIPWASC